ncbi:DegT/DnrJ/EryC1/StrS family aminotransferase [Collinsella ihumii]|uniref:DegT/DnrJ/EryC1/StrS family aminotransferase n=1 Tax=Collinsella ihumii TaxID=1720204 RepID=A0AAW7K3T2_9ACTN|nr:DegT/DnrJ/EryC1/StrS family aminotransferase [Collinsella ihumii]MDN0069546.1 DegT/DnrJ/EryC1/StrS family aminotransferase [Collinsella ihumii]
MEFIDLKAQHSAYEGEFDAAIRRVVDAAAFIGGEEVEELESGLASYVGRRFCAGCGNGTDALQLAYMALGVGEGDAVFCPAMTFVASVEPAVMLGAEPVFCDIDPASYNLDPASLEEEVLRVEREGRLRPAAVVAVDFLGNPADYGAIGRICDEHGLALIEDLAQGMGGSSGGRMLGSFGRIACTSFFPSKPLGCYGDGGAVFTDDEGLDSLVRSIRVHGKGDTKYDNVRVGVNSRLDSIQAAVLRVKLSHLDEEVAARQRVAARYRRLLAGSGLVLPAVADGDVSPYAQFILLAEDSAQRERVMSAMGSAGVPSLVYYPKPLHRMGAFERFGCAERSFPVAESYASRNFGLPFSAFLAEEDQDAVVAAVLSGLEG